MIDADGVYADVEVPAFEVEDGHVLWFQGSGPVAHVHSHPIQQVVAVRLDDQLAIPCGDPAEQAAEGCLRTGVQVYFWLLQQEHVRRIFTQQLRHHRRTWLTP